MRVCRALLIRRPRGNRRSRVAACVTWFRSQVTEIDGSRVTPRPGALRIYIDTSVLGGCFDREFATWSNGPVRDFRAGRLIPVLSDVTAAEVQDAPESVRDLRAAPEEMFDEHSFGACTLAPDRDGRGAILRGAGDSLK